MSRNRQPRIVGNQVVRELLTELCDAGNLPSCVAFEGPAGVGKRLFARWLAMRDVCTRDKRPCYECSDCRQVEAGLNLRVVEISPASEKKVGLDEVNQAMGKLEWKAISRRWCIFNDLDRFTEAAQNRLLKTIEEPPAETVFVGITASASLLLPTLSSRFSQFRFGRVSLAELKKAFPGVSDEALQDADGRPGRWLEFAEDEMRTQRENRTMRALDGNWFGVLGELEDEEEIRRQLDTDERVLRRTLMRAIRESASGELVRRIETILGRMADRSEPSVQNIAAGTIFTHCYAV